MKRFILVLIGCIIFLSACSAQNSASFTDPGYEPQGTEAKVIYNNLSDFVMDIQEVRSSKDEKNLTENDLTSFSLKETEILVPQTVPYTKGIEVIEVGNDAISFFFTLDDAAKRAAWDLPIIVEWHRDLTPEVLLNGFPLPDAITSKKIESNNGIIFYVEELKLLMDDAQTGYFVRWDYNGKAFSANVPTSFTDDDIFMLSNFEDAMRMKISE